jgi:hypothetical protein
MMKSRSLSLASSVSNRLSWFLPTMCAVLISASGASAARAQTSALDEVRSGPTSSDTAATDEATVVYRHAKPANTLAGSVLRQKEIAERGLSVAARRQSATEDNDQLRFPTDLTYNGGAVVQVAAAHAIYLLPNGTCPIAKCWGNPEEFLRDLGISEFVHITDEYVGTSANGRYTLGDHIKISYKPTPKTEPLTDADMQAFVHQAVTSLGAGTGYGNIYHVFLPPGQDECVTSKDLACYSPDNMKTFAFCGYHSSVNFKDIGHVLYTVEPFQNVPGCSVRPGTPNGQLVDSTNNTLSHETVETITDPDGDAWFNLTAVILLGAEIGDECSFAVFIPISPTMAQGFFDPSVSTIGKHRYAVQPEYANGDHACASNP